MRVLGMGNALVDVLTQLKSDDSLNVMGLPKGSMQLIDEAKLFSIIDEIKSFESKHASGGSAANTICGLAQLGIYSGFIGKTGPDHYGKLYAEELKKNNVVPHLLENNMASGCAMAMITPDGERTFGTYLGAAATLEAGDLHPGLFENYQFFHIEGYLIQNPELIRKACKLAKAAGCKISLDMASYNVVEANLDFFRELLTEYTDIVFANEEEAYAFTGKEPQEALDILGELCEIAVVKIGAKGSLIKRGTETTSAQAIEASCLDTTGAGDLYAAGFLYGLIHNHPLQICGQIGSLLSGNVIEFIGAKMDAERWKAIKEGVVKLTLGSN